MGLATERDAAVDLPAADGAGMAYQSGSDAWATERSRIENSAYWAGPAGRRSRWKTRIVRVAGHIFACGMVVAGLYRRGRSNALAPKLVELDLPLQSLPPAFDGYRILQLSDTHLDALPELAESASAILAGIEVDLLVLTGDILAAYNKPPGAATEPLARLLDGVVVRDRRLAVLGNHDPSVMAGALEDIGFEVLLNRSVSLERRGEHIAITGLDDVHYFYTDAARDALYEGSHDFRIALVHSPEMADHAADAGIALYLCGHTHGGQICLPGGRPVVTGLTRCHHAARGLWREGAMIGYTSSGLGTSSPTLRYNCRGEMALFTLRATGWQP